MVRNIPAFKNKTSSLLIFNFTKKIGKVQNIFCPCFSILVTTGYIQKWLKSARYRLWKEQEESIDFKPTINAINQLLATLKTKEEL